MKKRHRLSKEQAEIIVPYHIPTPKPTLLSTPSSPSSFSRSSNNGQGGGTRSPVSSSNYLIEDNNDDGAHNQGVVRKRNRKGSDDQAEDIHDYLGRVKMSGKSRLRYFQRSKRNNRPEGRHRPFTRSRSTMSTRKSQNITSS